MARVTVEDCLENVDNRFRWFLEGPVWARREALYISGYSDPDADQPTTIAVGDGMEMPGSVLLSDD